MPQASPQPPKQRKRRSSSTRFMRSAVAAGLTARSVKVDPITGEYTVQYSDPTPAKAGAEDDTVIETADELRKLI